MAGVDLRRRDVGLLVACGIATTIFVLQARFLSLADPSGLDEGVYAAVGNMIWAGHFPHLYVPFFHMPLLPAVIGAGLKIFGGMYPIRLIYLAVNCGSFVLLYVVLRNLGGAGNGTAIAAVLGVFTYATFREQLLDDFRFLAIRPPANVLLLAFLQVGLGGMRRRWERLAAMLIAIASGFLFLPAFLNLICLAIALCLHTDVSSRRQICRRFLIVLGAATLLIVLYLMLVPHALEQVVVDQMRRVGHSRWYRLWDVIAFNKRADVVVMLTGTMGAAIAAVWLPRLRAVAVAMLAIILAAIFVPVDYYAHFFVIAAPAFAFGVYAGALVLFRATRGLAAGPAIRIVVVGAFVAAQVRWAIPPMLHAWNDDRHPEYYALAADIAAAPDPVLVLRPSLAVDARKDLLPELWGGYMLPPVPAAGLSVERWTVIERQLCGALLTDGFMPDEILAQWKAKYRVVDDTAWGTWVIMDNPRCR